MNLVIAVICCNCIMAIAIFAIALWTMQLRRQMIGLTNFCDRCLSDWNRLSGNKPAVWERIAANRAQLQQLKQIYQQQLVTLDRVRTLGSIVSVTRSIYRR